MTIEICLDKVTDAVKFRELKVGEFFTVLGGSTLYIKGGREWYYDIKCGRIRDDDPMDLNVVPQDVVITATSQRNN